MTVPLDHELQQALQHERALRRLAAALLHDPADADDAVQHALVQEALGRRRHGTPLWPFLCTTLRNHAANLSKLATRRAVRERAAAVPEPVPAADELVQREQLRRRVADAVLALDEPYRTTVWLRWFEELPAEAVAERLQVPVPTVRSRLARAHAELRRRLDRDYGDRRWALLASPTAPIVATSSAVSVFALGLLMKKVLLTVGLLFVVALGYTLQRRSGDPAVASNREGASPVAAALPAHVPPGDELERQAIVRTLATTPSSPSHAAHELQIVHADGSPAAGLPVWWWNDDATRPRWTRRVDPRKDLMPWPTGTSSPQAPPPEPPTRRTDGQGRIAIPASESPVAITVECAPSLWFSVDLPCPAPRVILPPLGLVEADLQGAPPGSRWEALFYGAWREADGDDNHGPLRENVETRSGPGVLRMDRQHLELEPGQRLRALVPLGHLCAIEAWGRAFEIEPAVALVEAPGTVTFQFVRPFPRLFVAVVEPDGSPSMAAGKVFLTVKDGNSVENVVHGVATFDAWELPPSVYPIEALMPDGEWIRGDVSVTVASPEYQAKLVRGSGTAPVQVQLSDLPPTADIVAVVIEDEAHRFGDARPFPRYLGFREHRAVFSGSDQRLALNMLPPRWVQGFVVTRNCRVGRFGAAAAGETIAGEWLASAPGTTIDVGALYRELGDLPTMQAVLQVELVNTRGKAEWKSIRLHLRCPFQDDEEPPPVWSNLEFALGVRWRLTLSGGQTLRDMTLLREIALPRR